MTSVHLPIEPARPAAHIALVLRDFSTGGSERVAIRLANAWAATRRVTIFSGTVDGPSRALVDPAVDVAPVLPFSAAGDPPSRALLGRRVAGLVLGMRPDVVVGPGNHHAPVLAAMLAALGRRRPAIVCKLSNPLRRADRSVIGQAVFTRRFRAITARFDRLVAMSPALAAEAAILLGRTDIACIAEPTIEDDAGLPLAREPTGTIVCVGRLAPQKNVALAIEAFARAARPRRLLIVGEGEQYPELRSRTAALGLADRVRFTGYVRDPAAYLRVADAVLCSSRYEGYPAALVEALAAGAPLVTTPCSLAIPEIMVDPSFGLVAAAEPDALAAAIDRVLDEGRRPARGPLRELMRRHRLATSTAAWLDVLDGAAGVHAGGWTRPDDTASPDRRTDAAARSPGRSVAATDSGGYTSVR